MSTTTELEYGRIDWTESSGIRLIAYTPTGQARIILIEDPMGAIGQIADAHEARERARVRAAGIAAQQARTVRGGGGGIRS